MENLNLIKPEKVQNIINKFCYTIGMIPTSYKMSLTYEEQIIAIGHYLETTVYPAINNNAEALAELQNLFLDLKNYVDNYFDNLDIQTEINNKLDEMAQDGTLENIITQYISLQATFTFNNVQDLKNSTILQDGMYVRTSGFHNFNDGGGAFYLIRRITSNDIVDQKTIISVYDNTLIAQLIYKNSINVLKLGFFGDDEHDDTENFNFLNNLLNRSNISRIYFPNRIYKIDGTVQFEINNKQFEFEGKLHLKSSDTSETVRIRFLNSSNCIVNNLYIYSDLDKTEPAPTNHVRQDYTGSNVIGLDLKNSNNIKFNNIFIKNMYWDFCFEGTENNKTNNITVENYTSENSSMCVYSDYSEYINFLNCNIDLKANLGKGNHAFYFSHGTNNFNFENIKIIGDGYVGELFHFYTGNNHNFKNIKIKNVYAKCYSFYISEFCDNLLIDNIEIDGVKPLTDLRYLFDIQNNTNAILNNIVCNNLTNDTTFLFTYGSNNITINNLFTRIGEILPSVSNRFIRLDGTNNKILFNNCDIECNQLWYNDIDNEELIISNSTIKTINDNYLLSNRSPNGKVKFLNVTINFKNSIPLTYNGNMNAIPNSFKIFNSFLYNGASSISEAKYFPSFKIINSYNNDVPIT